MSSLQSRLTRALRGARDEQAFAMVVVVGVLFVTIVLLGAAFISAVGEIHASSTSTNQKKAYYAAEAGIANYLHHLNEDGNYLTYCTTPSPTNPALNQYYKAASGSEPKKASELSKASVPNGEGEEYAIQLIPAETAPAIDKQCDKTKPEETMIEGNEPVAGTFRIKSTGFANGQKRSIVASIKNEGFVSFVYYTVYETSDPITYGSSLTQEQKELCEHFYAEREEFKREGKTSCNDIYFFGFDNLHGPVHSEDHAGVCESPTFGRKKTDKIEFGHEGWPFSESGATLEKGYSGEAAGCTPNPTFKGTYVPVAQTQSIEPPPSDTELAQIAESAYKFTRRTEILLKAESLEITNWTSETTKTVTTKAYPPNGVLFVANGEGCNEEYTPYGSSYEDKKCGNVYIHGTYGKSLTVAAENSVIINGSIESSTTEATAEEGTKPTGTALMGLIANKFVRIYHPTEGGGENTQTNCTQSNGAGTNEELTLDASILAVNQSVIVDNFRCKNGVPLKKLNVYGAIAQKFRGPVGTFNVSTGSAVSGYTKNYWYDERLKAGEPPHFLNPVRAAWEIQRETVAPAPE